MKLCLCDLDGVAVNNEARFARANAQALGLTGKAWNAVFWATLFDPELVSLDVPIHGAEDALDLLQEAGFHISFLASRPLSMHDATSRFLQAHGLLTPGRDLWMKDYDAYRFISTPVWKASRVHALVTERDPSFTLVIDDEEKNRLKVSCLLVYQRYPQSWIITDSLFSDAVRSLVSLHPKEAI